MLKRAFDILVAMVLLVVFSPLLIIISIAIKCDSPGEIIFRQERVGKFGQIFLIHKFRTMKKNSSMQLTLGDGDYRITRVGKIVRKYHFDELLQLIDVLMGNMSLVGPRPEVPEFTKYHKEKWKEVLKIRPGITGYGTLKTLDFEYKTLANSKDPKQDYIKIILPKKLDLELEYLKKQSFLFDLKLMIITLKRFL